MAMNKKLQNFLPLIIFVAGMFPILFNIGTMGLLEPDEAYFGSVSRYMIDTENYFVPIFNGVKHFEYSPGIYWITATGLKLFGNSEFGARFFLSIAAGVTALCIFFIAKLFFGVQCAVISCLLLCTSALFQVSFRIISPAAYRTAFESLLCLIFFYFLNKPTKKLRFIFWLTLTLTFMFCGFSALLPIIAITVVAVYTGQTKQIKSLYNYSIGIIILLLFGFGWYIVQLFMNPGLLSYYLFKLPYNSFFVDYKGTNFFIFLILPIIAVFPWTTIWLQEIKNKIKDFKEDPVVTYLVSWAFLPFVIRLFMTSRSFTDFMSSLPPLLLLTTPAFQSLYFKKDAKTDACIDNVKLRKKHNFIFALSASIIGMTLAIYGYINFETASVISHTQIFTGIFWLFSSLIMVAFMIKKLNKSVLIPTAMLIPSLILFTVPAIQGHEPLSKDSFLSSKHNILNRIARMPASNFICCKEPLYGWYFYTGKTFRFITDKTDYDFITEEGLNLLITTKEALAKYVQPETFLVMPIEARNVISELLTKTIELSAEDNDWKVFVVTTEDKKK